MAKLYNLAAMTVASTGTGPLTLGTAATIGGVLYLAFAAAGAVNGETIAYSINDFGQSEQGTAVYSSAGPTITRTPVTSTNGNNPINVTGAAIVRISPARADIANLRESNIFTGMQSISASGIAADAPLTINLNTVALQSWTPGFIAHIGNADGVNTNLVLDAYGAVGLSTSLRGRVFGGTAEVPLATPAGSGLLVLGGNGYTNAATVASAAAISMVAKTLWSATNSDTYIALGTTPTGSTTRAEAMRIQSSGGVSIGAAAIAADPGIGSLNMTGNLTVTGATTLSGTLSAIAAFSYFAGAPGPNYPAANSYLSFGGNFSNGGAESVIWNTNDPATYAGTGLYLKQRITGSTYRDLMVLLHTGAVSIPGTLAVTGDGRFADVYASRTPNTGYLFLGSSGVHYFGYNGSTFELANGGLNIPSGAVIFGGTLAVTGVTTLTGVATFSSGGNFLRHSAPGSGFWYDTSTTASRFFVGGDNGPDNWRIYAAGISNNAFMVSGATGAVSIPTTLAVTGATTLTGKVTVGGPAQSTDALAVLGNDSMMVARASTTAGTAYVSAHASDYYSLPSFSSTSLRQYGSTAPGNTCGYPNASLGQLYFQNAVGLIGTNGNPIVFGVGASVVAMLQAVNTPSTSPATGTLTVVGGVGITGAVNIGGTLTSAGLLSFGTGLLGTLGQASTIRLYDTGSAVSSYGFGVEGGGTLSYTSQVAHNWFINGTTSVLRGTASGVSVPGTLTVTGSATFVGPPSGPTAAAGTNTTQLATTAFVLANTATPTSAAFSVKGNRTGATAATADLVSPILTSIQLGYTGAPGGTRFDARDSTLTNNTAVYTEGQRSVSSVVNDTVVTVNSVTLDTVDAGAGRFVMRSLGTANGYPASTKGALTRALEAQVLVDSSIPNDANRATWGMELGLHSQLAGNGADKNVGIYLASSHAGWLPTGVRNDTGIFITGADGWVNAIRYMSTDNTTILFNVDQTGTVSAAAASVGNLVSTNLTILKGTTAGDDAAAGNIGQYIPVVSGTLTAITSVTQTNIANLPLAAGDWDVYGEVNFYPGSAATIIYDAIASISLTSATLDQGTFNAGRLSFAAAGIAPGLNFNNTVKAGPRRISIPAGPGLTAFLVGYTTFSGGTMFTTGGIRARRVR